MAQMQTISIRLPDEDFQWLSTLQEAGARTPSEKLRALLARIRDQESGLSDPERCAVWMRSLAQPFVTSVATYERQQKIHSELIGAVTEWVPQLMAILVGSRLPDATDQAAALEVEAVLAQQCFQLLAALLRAAVTTKSATYDQEVLARYLPDILEIAAIIAHRKTTQEQSHD